MDQESDPVKIKSESITGQIEQKISDLSDEYEKKKENDPERKGEA